MKSRKWKRKVGYTKKEEVIAVPFPREDRLSAIVPIDRICVEGKTTVEENKSFEELCESVRRNGVLQPLLLRRICDEESSFGGVYLLVAGKRRLEAARLAGHRAVPCYIVTMDAKEAAATAFVTDIDRVSRNMFELSDAIREMQERFSMSIPEIAERIGKSEIYTAGKLLLQRYTAQEREFILNNDISEDVALILLQIRNADQRELVLKQVWEKKLNRASTADYVHSILSGAMPTPKNSLSDLRFFYNSVDRLMDALRRSGADAALERNEYADETVVTIRIVHKTHALSGALGKREIKK